MAQKAIDTESSGWIKLYRSLFFHEFADEPWNRITAWMYLVSLAAYKPYDATYRRHVYHLERGQAAIVMSDLAIKAQWSKWRVKRFFDLLVKKNMVVVRGDFTCCVLTILNYEKYQSENAALPATANATPTATANATQNKKVVQEVLRKGLKTEALSPEVSEVLAYLNEKVKRNFKVPGDIPARLKDYSVEDCKTVIDKKCREWLGTDLARHLDPVTLFRPANFDRYLNQVEVSSETITFRQWIELNPTFSFLQFTDEYAKADAFQRALKEAKRDPRVKFTDEDFEMLRKATRIKTREAQNDMMEAKR